MSFSPSHIEWWTPSSSWGQGMREPTTFEKAAIESLLNQLAATGTGQSVLSHYSTTTTLKIGMGALNQAQTTVSHSWFAIQLNLGDEGYYVSPTGFFVQQEMLGVLVHELAHIDDGIWRPDPSGSSTYLNGSVDYDGHAIDIQNDYMAEVGRLDDVQISYGSGIGGDDLRGYGLAAGVSYTDGYEIDAVRWSRELNETIDTSQGPNGNSASRDLIFGLNGGDNITSGAGDDHVYAGVGNDTVNGGDGNDRLIGERGADSIVGGAGNDLLVGGELENNVDSENDTLDGGEGADELRDEKGSNSLSGGEGPDKLVVKEARNTLEGGAGNDLIDLIEVPEAPEGGEAVTVTFSAGDGYDWVEFGAPSKNLHIVATDFSSGDVELTVYITSDGPIRETGSLDPGEEDPLERIYEVNVFLKLGDDTIYLGKGEWGELYDYSGQLDRTYITDFREPVLDLSDGTYDWGAFDADSVEEGPNYDQGSREFDEARGNGSAGADSTTGGSGNDDLRGLGGNDQLAGGAGADKLRGDEGADTLAGGDGNDVLEGGAGNDLALLAGASTDYTFTWQVDGSVLTTALSGAEGVDRLIGIESVKFLGSGSTVDIATLAGARGDESDNSLSGTSGEDYLFGLAGDDTLTGGQGNDVLGGDEGFDRLVLSGTVGQYDFLRGADGTVTIIHSGSDGTDTVTGIEELYFAGNSSTFSLDAVSPHGTDGDDDLVGTSQSEIIYGLYGNDTLDGYIASDTIYGGRGNDSLDGGSSGDAFVYVRGDGHDTISEADGGIDTLFLEDIDPSQVSLARASGNLTLTIAESAAGAGDGGSIVLLDSLGTSGTNGVELIVFSGGLVWNRADMALPTAIAGTSGNDTLTGTSAVESLDGGEGDDRLQGSTGADNYYFESGDGNDTIIEPFDSNYFDRLILGPGLISTAVTISRGTDKDDVTLSFGTAGSILLDEQLESLGTSYGVEQIQFADGVVWSKQDLLNAYLDQSRTDGADTIYGSSVSDTIDGGGGNDRLEGLNGSDTYFFYMGGGDDRVVENLPSSHIDRLVLGTGLAPANLTLIRSATDTDDITLSFGFKGSVYLDEEFASDGPGEGVEEIEFGDGTIWTRRDLLDAYIASATTSGADTIFGGAGSDTLSGQGGNDHLKGLEGGDTYVFNAGDGNDVIIEDVPYSNIDRLVLESGLTTSNLTIVRSTSDTDDVTLDFGIAGSILLDEGFRSGGNGYGIEEIEFGDATVWSRLDLVNAYFATIQTGGNDSILGTGGADSIAGGAGNDTIDGRAGNDTIVGGSGADRLSGYINGDHFVYLDVSDAPVGGSPEIITDFSTGLDKIDLTAIDADAGTSGDQAFSFIGTAAFSSVAGQLRYEATPSGSRTVYGDVNGDGAADFQIQLTGTATLAASDFLL